MVNRNPIYDFPRRRRLLHSPEFDRLYKLGRRIITPYFVLYGIATDSDTSRLGLTVSRKMGNAVQRNRIKRVVRDLFRRHRPSLLPRAYDLVVNARRGIGKASYAELEAAFCQAVVQLVSTDRSRKP